MKNVFIIFSLCIFMIGCSIDRYPVGNRGSIHERMKQQCKVEVMAFVSGDTSNSVMLRLCTLRNTGFNVDVISIETKPELAKYYGISIDPTFIVVFMDGGKILDGYDGKFPIYETFSIRTYHINVVEKILKDNTK